MKHIFISILIALASCTKHPGDNFPEVPTATIEVISPAVNAMHNLSDSISILAKCISTETIHGYDLVITKFGDTGKLYNTHVHDHNDTIVVNKKWKGNITGNFELALTFALDHDGNTASKKVKFSLQ